MRPMEKAVALLVAGYAALLFAVAWLVATNG